MRAAYEEPTLSQVKMSFFLLLTAAASFFSSRLFMTMSASCFACLASNFWTFLRKTSSARSRSSCLMLAPFLSQPRVPALLDVPAELGELLRELVAAVLVFAVPPEEQPAV